MQIAPKTIKPLNISIDKVIDKIEKTFEMGESIRRVLNRRYEIIKRIYFADHKLASGESLFNEKEISESWEQVYYEVEYQSSHRVFVTWLNLAIDTIRLIYKDPKYLEYFGDCIKPEYLIRVNELNHTIGKLFYINETFPYRLAWLIERLNYIRSYGREEILMEFEPELINSIREYFNLLPPGIFSYDKLGIMFYEQLIDEIDKSPKTGTIKNISLENITKAKLDTISNPPRITFNIKDSYTEFTKAQFMDILVKEKRLINDFNRKLIQYFGFGIDQLSNSIVDPLPMFKEKFENSKPDRNVQELADYFSDRIEWILRTPGRIIDHLQKSKITVQTPTDLIKSSNSKDMDTGFPHFPIKDGEQIEDILMTLIRGDNDDPANHKIKITSANKPGRPVILTTINTGTSGKRGKPLKLWRILSKTIDRAATLTQYPFIFKTGEQKWFDGKIILDKDISDINALLRKVFKPYSGDPFQKLKNGAGYRINFVCKNE